MKNQENDMRKFILKVTIFLFILGLVFSPVILSDPFKVFRDYDNFYQNSMIGINREMVCFKLFARNNDKYHYDSFILGNSRSQAYKIESWENYLPEGSTGFHFDASGDGLYGIYNKLKYIDKSGNDISNALIILDDKAMNCVSNKTGQLYISPPELSNESYIDYYLTFITASIDHEFLTAYVDYSIFNTYRPYMENIFCEPTRYKSNSNNITGDYFYSADQWISEDKKGYYERLISKGIFYDRTEKVSQNQEIKPEEIDLLQKIASILKKHNTDYRIVISPLYDQVPFNSERMDNLVKIFGSEHIFDYSGKNEFTESIYNYYEDSHYRPHVAEAIMREIYAEGNRN